MTDYWLSKLFFDLQHDAQLVADYRADMAAVIERYRIKPEVRRALMDDDVAALSPLVNAYLLRFYFQVRGMPQDEFMARLHAMNAPGAPGEPEKVGHGSARRYFRGQPWTDHCPRLGDHAARPSRQIVGGLRRDRASAARLPARRS